MFDFELRKHFFNKDFRKKLRTNKLSLRSLNIDKSYNRIMSESIMDYDIMCDRIWQIVKIHDKQVLFQISHDEYDQNHTVTTYKALEQCDPSIILILSTLSTYLNKEFNFKKTYEQKPALSGIGIYQSDKKNNPPLFDQLYCPTVTTIYRKKSSSEECKKNSISSSSSLFWQINSIKPN